MTIASYSDLKTAILAWSARSDLSSTIQDEVIDMAESVIKRAPEPRNSALMGGIRANKTRATGTFTAATSGLALPSDFLELDELLYTDSAGGHLQYVAVDELGRIKDSGSGRPSYFTIQDIIQFDVPSDSAYSYQLSYWPSFTALSGSNTTNWLITNYPDAYLACCLYFVGQYTKDTEMITTWATAYREAAYTINKTYRRGQQSQGPISIKVAGSTP